MFRILRYPLLAVLLIPATGPAQEDAKPRAPRQYTSTVTLHDAPPGIVPRDTNEVTIEAADLRGSAPNVMSSPALQSPLVLTPPPRPPPPERTKEKDWLSPSTLNSSTEDKKDKPSGWGWLADEVSQKEAQKQNERDEATSDNDQTASTSTNGFLSRTDGDRQEYKSELQTFEPAFSTRQLDSDNQSPLDKQESDRPNTAGAVSAADKPIASLQDYFDRAWSDTDPKADPLAYQVGPPTPDRGLAAAAIIDAPGTDAQLDEERKQSLFMNDAAASTFAPVISSPTFVSDGSVFGSRDSSGFPAPAQDGGAQFGGAAQVDTANSYAQPASLSESSRKTPALNSSLDAQAYEEATRPKALPW